MIRYKDTILEDYFIDPVTAIITNSNGEIQKIKINERGRPCFNCMEIHKIQAHTNLGYKKGLVIHHLDHNKINNSLSNLVYLTRSEHAKIHGENMSEETKLKIGKASKGRRRSEEWKKKLSAARKGIILINNGVISKMVKCNEDIPEGFVRGRLKKMSDEHKRKIGEANKDRIWINNGVISKMLKCNEAIPEGFVRGMLKKMNKKFIKICFDGFKKNDEKFPEDWSLDDYKKYTEECNRILENERMKENEEREI